MYAREKIINVHDDIGLKALNGYYESPIIVFSDDADDEFITEKMVNLFKDAYAELLDPNITIEFTIDEKI